jgi:protein ImuB
VAITLPGAPEGPRNVATGEAQRVRERSETRGPHSAPEPSFSPPSPPPRRGGGNENQSIGHAAAGHLRQPLICHTLTGPLAELLAYYPVAALRLDDATLDALAEVAIDRIGDLLALRRSALVERFGVALIRRLDLALGRAAAPETITSIRPVDPVIVERAFAGPVTQFEAIDITLRELAHELSAALTRRDEGVRTLLVEAERYHAHTLRTTLQFSQPTADAGHIWTLLKPKSERIDLSHGIETLRLTASAADRLLHAQSTCWPDDPFTVDRALAGDFGRFIDLLVARLGPESVCRIDVRETHTPEAAFTPRSITLAKPGPAWSPRDQAGPGLLDPLTPAAQHAPGSHDLPITPGDRPSILLEHPRRIDTVILTPDGPVVSITDGDTVRPIITTVGPERIAGRWWLMTDPTAAVPQRDYFKLQDDTGRWWWVYRRLLPQRTEWFLHGEWD